MLQGFVFAKSASSFPPVMFWMVRPVPGGPVTQPVELMLEDGSKTVTYGNPPGVLITDHEVLRRISIIRGFELHLGVLPC